jgi:hypothetical protein
MRHFAVVTKLGLVFGAFGLLMRWPFGNSSSFYLAWIAVFGALEISTVPGVSRSRISISIIAGLLLLGLALLVDGLLKI